MTGPDVSGMRGFGRRLLQTGDRTEILCPKPVRGFVSHREGFTGKERKDIHDRLTTLSYPIHILQSPKSSKNKKIMNINARARLSSPEAGPEEQTGDGRKGV